MKSGDIVVYKNEVGTVVSDYENKDILRFLPCNYGRYYSSELDAITENDVREATHEEKLELIEREYHWGRVIKIHCVGEYQIVEAIRDDKDENVHYHGYINYDDTNTSYSSLDSALVGCIGRKYEGGNGKAAMYFCKMIDMK